MNKKKTHKAFLDRLTKKYGNKFSVLSPYIGCDKHITVFCNDCHTTFDTTPDNLLKAKIGCKECVRRSLVRPIVGVNDLWTSRPDVAELLSDPNDGFLYMENSHQSVIFKCPLCGNKELARISTISKNGFSCENCGDGLSYPEKLMLNILNQKGICYEFQYSPSWIRPRRYDFKVSINGLDYIIEMDGGIGHGNSCNGIGVGVEETLEIDRYKDTMAYQHGFNVIRIDCNYRFHNRFEYIKSNIISSELSRIIDISDVDWMSCNLQAQKSLFIKVCELWNNGMRDHYKIAKEVGLHPTSVTNYLKRSEDLKITDYVHEKYYDDAIKRSRKKASITQSCPVRCIETGEIFKSIHDANKKYHCYLNYYFNGKHKSAGKLPDGTRLHWEKLSEEDALAYKLTIQNDLEENV